MDETFTSKTYGLTTDDMWAFFAGPAFLPWGRMEILELGRRNYVTEGCSTGLMSERI